MVTIEYSPDPTEDTLLIGEYETVADFLRDYKFTREELVDLRYYKTDMLGDEIDTSDGMFIKISENVVFVTHDSKTPRGPETWIPLLVSFAVSAVMVFFIDMPGVTDVGSRKQGSSTNSLGESNNEPAEPGSRIDDIFGFVPKHTTKLWQQPYRIGVDNQEVEVLLTCIGRGQYEHSDDRVFDGDTLYKQIPNASANFYGPGTYPGNGAPYSIIGDLIDQKIGIYRQPNDLNPSELLPPNDLDVTAINWSITTTDNGDGSYSVEFYGVNAEAEEVDLTTYFNAGDDVDVRDIVKMEPNGSITLYYVAQTSGQSRSFNKVTPVRLDGTFNVDQVTTD